MTSEVHQSCCRPPQEKFSSLPLIWPVRPTTTDKRAFLWWSQPPLGVEAREGTSLTSFLATWSQRPTGPRSGHVLDILNLVTQFTVQPSLSCTSSSANWSFCLLPSCCAHSSCFIRCNWAYVSSSHHISRFCKGWVRPNLNYMMVSEPI